MRAAGEHIPRHRHLLGDPEHYSEAQRVTVFAVSEVVMHRLQRQELTRKMKRQQLLATRSFAAKHNFPSSCSVPWP